MLLLYASRGVQPRTPSSGPRPAAGAASFFCRPTRFRAKWPQFHKPHWIRGKNHHSHGHGDGPPQDVWERHGQDHHHPPREDRDNEVTIDKTICFVSLRLLRFN
jgi:hypothetical protein